MVHAVPKAVPQSAGLSRQVVAGAVSSNGGSVATAHQGAGPPAGGPPATEQFQRDLLQTVTLRTGYPIEMLNLDLPLEAGLGIDSIKTLEIFNALKQYHHVLPR